MCSPKPELYYFFFSKLDRHVVVHEVLVKKLASLRFRFAKLLRNHEKKLCSSPEAQEEFVESSVP